MRRSGGWIGLGIGVALAMACAEAPAQEARVEGKLVTLDDLADSAWLVEEIQGQSSAEGVRSTLGFRGMTVYGSGGCNRFNAKAGQREGVLELGAIASTRRMCEPPAMDQEQRYLAALDRVARFRLAADGTRLRAVDADGAPVLRLTRIEGEA